MEIIEKLPSFDEILFLCFIIVVSFFMLTTTFSFDQSSAIFPRYLSIFVIVASILLLGKGFLPESMNNILSEGVNLSSRISEEGKDESEPEESQIIDRPVSPFWFTLFLLVLYPIAGYMIGLLWASPLFVFIYTIWFNRPWYIIILYTFVTFLLAYGFSLLIIAPYTEGVLLMLSKGGLGWF